MSTTSLSNRMQPFRFAPGIFELWQRTATAENSDRCDNCSEAAESSFSAVNRDTNVIIAFRNLRKRYAKVEALRAVNLSIARGSVLAVLGPNGAGKSTLFGCLLGLTRPSGGSILWNGRGIADADRNRFGYVAERVALYPQRTIRENGLFFARLKGHGASELTRQLERVGLGAVQHRPVRQLSKGMLQRLGLAIALCGEPDVLVLDEPFNGLDPALLEGLQRILKEENERGATLLISTHTISAVELLATDIAILLRGDLSVSTSLQALRGAYPPELSLQAIYHQIARRNRSENPEEILP